MTNYELDQEEQGILEAFESKRLKTIDNKEFEIKKHKEYAASTLEMNEKITINISYTDWEAIQKIAKIEGIQSNALISNIIHKYIEERYIGKNIL